MHRIIIPLFIAFPLLVSLSCENALDSEKSKSGSVSVSNSFGQAIQYELWKGENLEYADGVIRGKTVDSVVATTTLNNGSNQSGIASFSGDTQFLFVFGATSYYVNHTVFTPSGNVTVTVRSDGTLSVE